MLCNWSMIWLSAGLAALSILHYIWHRFFSLQGLPGTIPWAGAEQGILSRAKVTWQSFFGMRELIEHGYQKVRESTLNPKRTGLKDSVFDSP